MKRILGLDLFRFMVALGIMCYHYFFIGPIQGFYSNQVFHPLAFWGEFGVDIFFIISGFVILFSTEKVKSSLLFLKKRALRIYPAFIICSIFTLLCGFIMPNTNSLDLLIRWLNSFTFYEDLWGVSPLSSVYWTLMIEIKFYILVAIVLRLKIWEKHKYKILLIWLSFSLLNTFIIHNKYIEMLFITKYSGHFVFGMMLYYAYKNIKNIKVLLIGILSIIPIYINMLSYTNWIREIYKGLTYSNIDIFIGLIIIIALLYFFINYYKNILPIKLVTTLGGLSFIFYLLHADFGYFLRTQYYIRFAKYITLNEHIIMLIEIICSLILSYIVLIIVNKITKVLKKQFRI